jgi:hypothetical protein
MWRHKWKPGLTYSLGVTGEAQCNGGSVWDTTGISVSQPAGRAVWLHFKQRMLYNSSQCNYGPGQSSASRVRLPGTQFLGNTFPFLCIRPQILNPWFTDVFCTARVYFLMSSIFGSNCRCEELLSSMKKVKPRTRTRLVDGHFWGLHANCTKRN